MKPVTLLLAASTVALAVATGYLGHELAAARAEADDAARLASYLGARVTELQSTRAAAVGAPAAPGVAPPPPQAGTSPAAVAGVTAEDQFAVASEARGTFAQRMQSPAMQRALRAQLRTGAKRMYSDFAAEYGLTPEEAAALYDLVAKQQIDPNFDPTADPRQNESQWREREQGFQKELVALLGDTRAARLREYQGTFEARGQISQLEDQLAGSQMPMSEEQRRRLVKVALLDAEQFPSPNLNADQSPEEVERAYRAWQRDRSERFAAAAGSILTPEQMQQFQDMREMQSALYESGSVN